MRLEWECLFHLWQPFIKYIKILGLWKEGTTNCTALCINWFYCSIHAKNPQPPDSLSPSHTPSLVSNKCNPLPEFICLMKMHIPRTYWTVHIPYIVLIFLSVIEWLLIFILLLLLQVKGCGEASCDSLFSAPIQGYLLGILSACLSALAGVYTEFLMKKNNDSFYWQNVQLYT